MPAIWSLEDFFARPRYRRLVGIKRITRTVSEHRVVAWARPLPRTVSGQAAAEEDRGNDVTDASRLRELAADARPIVVGVCGCPGAGKTTVASAVADQVGLARLHRDTIKNGLGVSTATVDPDGTLQLPEPFHVAGGPFSLQAETILQQVARLLVQSGCSFVVETSVLTSELLALVHAADGVFLAVEVVADPAVVETRLRARTTEGEATAHQLLAQFLRGEMTRPIFAPPREADWTVVLDTSKGGVPDVTPVQLGFRAAIAETWQRSG